MNNEAKNKGYNAYGVQDVRNEAQPKLSVWMNDVNGLKGMNHNHKHSHNIDKKLHPY